jgi:hypothetical protein
MPRQRRQSELPGAAAAYAALVAQRGEVCAICGAPPKTRKLHLDHDHKTGRVRGLLCYRCNRFLHSWMTPAWLRAAAAYVDGEPGELPTERVEYLQRHPEQRLIGGRVPYR